MTTQSAIFRCMLILSSQASLDITAVHLPRCDCGKVAQLTSMPASDDTTQSPVASPSNSYLLRGRERIADISSLSLTDKSGDETTLVKEFIRIADAANADQPADRGCHIDALTPIVWYLTRFVSTPSFLDQQVRAACFDVQGVSFPIAAATHAHSLLARSWLHARSVLHMVTMWSLTNSG